MRDIALKRWDKTYIQVFAKKYGAIGVFSVLILVNIITTRNFFRISTIWNVIMQMAPVLYISIGMTFVIGTSGIDLSVGSILAFTSIISARLLVSGYPLFLTLIISLMIGTIAGMFNGFVAGKIKIQPIILTIVMQMVLRGCAIFVSGGKSIPITNKLLKDLGIYRFAGNIPVQIIFVIIIVVIGYILAQKTRLGCYVEAIGVNEKAALLNGISLTAVTVIVYMISGFLSAAAGILEVARSGAVDPSIIGDLYEVDAIAAVAIGGTSLDGGKPNIIGTLFGVVIMILIKMTINMNNIPYEISNVVKAFIILFSLFMQRENKA